MTSLGQCRLSPLIPLYTGLLSVVRLLRENPVQYYYNLYPFGSHRVLGHVAVQFHDLVRAVSSLSSHPLYTGLLSVV
jgi:hypothetical protein